MKKYVAILQDLHIFRGIECVIWTAGKAPYPKSGCQVRQSFRNRSLPVNVSLICNLYYRFCRTCTGSVETGLSQYKNIQSKTNREDSPRINIVALCLNPMDSLYAIIQKEYLTEQTRLYRTNHIYGIDPF